MPKKLNSKRKITLHIAYFQNMTKMSKLQIESIFLHQKRVSSIQKCNVDCNLLTCCKGSQSSYWLLNLGRIGCVHLELPSWCDARSCRSPKWRCRCRSGLGAGKIDNIPYFNGFLFHIAYTTTVYYWLFFKNGYSNNFFKTILLCFSE